MFNDILYICKLKNTGMETDNSSAEDYVDIVEIELKSKELFNLWKAQFLIVQI